MVIKETLLQIPSMTCTEMFLVRFGKGHLAFSMKQIIVCFILATQYFYKLPVLNE